MRFTIVAVGKLKERYWTDAVEEYTKRLSRYGYLTIVEVPEGRGGEEEIKEEEAAHILKKLKGFTILTDLGGASLTSAGLASVINGKLIAGSSEFCFIIGGSHGVADSVKTAADLVVNFGAFTYPHQLMRVILCEQIYRSVTIINNITYHK